MSHRRGQNTRRDFLMCDYCSENHNTSRCPLYRDQREFLEVTQNICRHCSDRHSSENCPLVMEERRQTRCDFCGDSHRTSRCMFENQVEFLEVIYDRCRHCYGRHRSENCALLQAEASGVGYVDLSQQHPQYNRRGRRNRGGRRF